jgi:hypothetical protein
MIVDFKSICKDVAKENDIDLNALLSINNLVFKEISDWSKNPTSLRVYLKHFGNWYFKKQKTDYKLSAYTRTLEHDPTLLDVNREKILNIVKNYNFILSEYDKYTKEKYEIKCKKYGKQAYEAYCMAKKQEKIQKAKKDKFV